MSVPKVKAVIEFEGKKYRVVGDISCCCQSTNGKLEAMFTDGKLHKVKLIEEKEGAEK